MMRNIKGKNQLFGLFSTDAVTIMLFIVKLIKNKNRAYNPVPYLRRFLAEKELYY